MTTTLTPSPIPHLDEAAQDLDASLTKYCGRHKYITIGQCEDPRDPHLIIYTTTRSQGNSLLAFIGYKHNGFKVITRALGRVRVLG